jgi:hypothetical protein
VIASALRFEPEPVVESDPLSFVFGAVAFEICPAPGLRWAHGPDHRLLRAPVTTSGPLMARVDCSVAAAPELARNRTRAIAWEWHGEVARLDTGGVRAEVRRLAPKRYVVSALVSPDASGCSSLCTALVGAIAHAEGGIVLHASGIDVEGSGVLFVGPSGAGKTTSANHCAGATWFARDRAVVFPTSAGWHVAAMAGGDVIDLPRSAGAVFPVGAILRVRRGAEGRPEIREDGLAAQLVTLRESLQSVPHDPSDEDGALDRLLALSREARVASVHTVLRQPLLPELHRWLRA